MRMELIQPFINAADAVFAESLQAPTKIVDLSMDEETYRRKGVAALILIKGDIEGRVILDLAPEVALKIASHLAGGAVPRQRTGRPRNRLRARQHGDRKFRDSAQRSGLSLQSVSAGNSHERTRASPVAPTPKPWSSASKRLAARSYLNIAMHYLHRRRHERDIANVMD